MTAYASPCTKDCTLDPATGLCRGCQRTIEEIVRWGSASEAEKALILAAVKRRRAGTGKASHRGERGAPETA